MKLRDRRLPAWAAAPLLRALAKSDLAGATAWVARLTMHQLAIRRPQDEAVKQKEAKWRVVVLPKAGLRDDATSTFSHIGAIQVMALPRKVIKAIARAFLPGEVNDNSYATASAAAGVAKIRYRAFLTRFWRSFDPKRRIDAVISGNFAYYAEQELAAALEDLGVPFIALHKENSWTPGTQDFWGQIYRERRGPFLGRRILVYSPVERDLQLRAGIVDAQRIEVVGMPRLDDVHRWRAANIGAIPKAVVLFASFPTDVGMPVLRKGTLRDGPQGMRRYKEVMTEGADSLVVSELCRATHRVLVALAASCPDINVVVKTKGRTRDRTDVLGWLGVENEQDLPVNMRIVHGGSPLPLISEAAVVCGFHSTVLLEALAAGRPVIVPWFAEVLTGEISRHVFDLDGAVSRASSPADLRQKLEIAARARSPVPAELSVETLALLREWVGNADGRASERAAGAIRQVIEANRPVHRAWS